MHGIVSEETCVTSKALAHVSCFYHGDVEYVIDTFWKLFPGDERVSDGDFKSKALSLKRF